MRFTATFLLCFSMLCASVQASTLSGITARLPEVDAPPQGEARWVARSMRLNGLPMTLKEFHSKLTPDAVMHHYESWSRGLAGAKTKQSVTAPWRVLAIQARCCYITVQARATLSGSEGTLAVSPPLRRARLTMATSFPKPSTAMIVNLQQYDDHGVESEHIALTSVRSVAIEASAFAQLLSRDGWTLIRDQCSKDIARGHVLEAQKGAQHALITFLPDQARASATAIVIVWRKA